MPVRIFAIDAALLPDSAADVQVTTADELVMMVGKLAAHLIGQNVDIDIEDYDYIDTIDARRIAFAEGVDIPVSTLKRAITHRSIPGAHKPSGRWEMPEKEFHRWFAAYKKKKKKSKF